MNQSKATITTNLVGQTLGHAIGTAAFAAGQSVLHVTLWLELWKRARALRYNVALCTGEIEAPLSGRGRGSYAGLCVREDRVIYLAPGHWANPYTLAHEVGHAVLFKRVGRRHTEAQANTEARRLIAEALPGVEEVLADEIEQELPVKMKPKKIRRR